MDQCALRLRPEGRLKKWCGGWSVVALAACMLGQAESALTLSKKESRVHLFALNSDIGLDGRPDWWARWRYRGVTQPPKDNLIESSTTDQLRCNSCPCVGGSAIFGNIQFKCNAIYSWAPCIIQFCINCCELTWTDVNYRWYMNVVGLFRNGSILL